LSTLYPPSYSLTVHALPHIPADCKIVVLISTLYAPASWPIRRDCIDLPNAAVHSRVMEPQGSSKRTRSYRGVPEGAHNAQNTLATGFGSHPQYKEHAMLAPMGVSQSEEPLQHSRSQKKLTGEFGRECQASDTNSGSLSSTTSTTQQQTLPIKRHSANSQVILSNSSVLSECLLIPPKVEETGEVQEFSLAVVGCPAVGKSTFVHRALDLKKASSSRVSSKKMCWEGRTSIVQLLEIGLEDVEVTAEQKVLWPEKVRDQDRPDIDGVLALYDVMDQSSIAPMPSLLSESIRVPAAHPFKHQSFMKRSSELFSEC